MARSLLRIGVSSRALAAGWMILGFILTVYFLQLFPRYRLTGWDFRWTGHSWSALKWGSLYSHRRTVLQEACHGLANETAEVEKVKGRLFVDYNHGVIFCPIAKVASTFFRRVFQVSSGLVSHRNPFAVNFTYHIKLNRLSQPEIGNRQGSLGNYTSVVFVREPYGRLFSCYVDKFFSANTLFWKIGQNIIKNHRQNASALSLSCGHDVTFAEFIKHVISSLENGDTANGHWRPMYRECRPCQVHFDVIGKLETLSSDLQYMVQNYISAELTEDGFKAEGDVDRLIQNTRGFFKRYNTKAKQCLSFPKHLRRFLRKLQSRGLIGKSVEFPARLFRGTTFEEVTKFLLSALRWSTGDDGRRRAQRREALVEAYSSIPMGDMVRLRRIYGPDFQLFGYDPTPTYLFTRNSQRNTQPFYFN